MPEYELSKCSGCLCDIWYKGWKQATGASFCDVCQDRSTQQQIEDGYGQNGGQPFGA